jgi:CDP-glucose 4,6-dehydratase
VENLDVSGVDPSFWRGRRVLLTGHTGFKGAWCSLWLARMGADVTGVALPPDSDPNLFVGASIAKDLTSCTIDLRDRDAVRRAIQTVAPEIVLHLAAQSLVPRSVREPVETIATNVLGTTHLLDALRRHRSAYVVLIVTTDKVYRNADLGGAFLEDDPLGGNDPYAASKAAAEIVTHALARTYFDSLGIPVATARGGNVIGGGDYAEDRLVPDIVRAATANERLKLRSPESIRPWQHVLDCLAGYLMYVQALTQQPNCPRALNIGPSGPGYTVREVAETMLQALGCRVGWEPDTRPAPRESRWLSLDTGLVRQKLGWRDKLPGRRALESTASWYSAVARGISMRKATLDQIDAFMAGQPTFSDVEASGPPGLSLA